MVKILITLILLFEPTTKIPRQTLIQFWSPYLTRGFLKTSPYFDFFIKVAEQNLVKLSKVNIALIRSLIKGWLINQLEDISFVLLEDETGMK